MQLARYQAQTPLNVDDIHIYDRSVEACDIQKRRSDTSVNIVGIVSAPTIHVYYWTFVEPARCLERLESSRPAS